MQTSGHELKLVWPQRGFSSPQAFADWQFDYFYLQPLDDIQQRQHTAEAIAWCMAHPQWQLSLQTHKLTGIR